MVNRINATFDNGPAIMRAYRIPGHPALLFFDDRGQEVERLVGPQTKQVVEESVQKILVNSSQD